MDANRFDRLTRAILVLLTRRSLVGAAGLAAMILPGWGEAKKKQKKRIKRNQFGCVKVGKFCRHNSQCCSGICKGKKDKKKCKAHDTRGCRSGAREIFCGGVVDISCTTATGAGGLCDTTTGNAGYCTGTGDCFPCAKDADCRPFCGPGAACIKCEGECADQGGTLCGGLDECVFPKD